MFGKEWVDIGIESVHMILEPMVRIFFLSNVLLPRYNKRKTQFFYIVFMALIYLISYLTDLKENHVAIHSVIYWSLDIISVLWLFKNPIKRRIGMAVFYFSVMTVFELIATVFQQIVYPDMTVAEFYDLPFRRFFSAFLILIISTVLVTIVCLFNKIKKKDALPIIGIELALTITELFLTYAIYISSDGFSSASVLLITVIAMLPATAVNLLVYSIVVKAADMVRKEKERDFMEQKQKSEYEYYLLATENEKTLREIRHDLANNLQTAKILFENGNKEKAIAIIDEISKKQQEAKSIRYCNNPTINTVLSLKVKKAQTMNIPVSCRVDNEIADTVFTDAELSSLLTNLFDNAIEGTVASKTEAPNIQVFIHKQAGNFHLIFKNPVSPAHQPKRFSFETTKSDKENHGYGTKIIRQIAKQHGGTILSEISDGAFTVNVMIPEAE